MASDRMTHCSSYECRVDNCIRNYKRQYELQKIPMKFVDWYMGCPWVLVGPPSPVLKGDSDGKQKDG